MYDGINEVTIPLSLSLSLSLSHSLSLFLSLSPSLPLFLSLFLPFLLVCMSISDGEKDEREDVTTNDHAHHSRQLCMLDISILLTSISRDSPTLKAASQVAMDTTFSTLVTLPSLKVLTFGIE